jgi:glucose-6-phosphate isomerase
VKEAPDLPLAIAPSPRTRWRRYCERRCDVPDCGLTLDVSRVSWNDRFVDSSLPKITAAFDAMRLLEAGALANLSEDRMVGHYWLRAPALAPQNDLRRAIADAIRQVRAFSQAVAAGDVRGTGGPFEHVIHVGIGGSALGPQLLCDALGTGRIQVHFLDNADPDGVDRVLRALGGSLDRTLVSVVSKCGWTPTTQHLTLELAAEYARTGVPFAKHAVATTVPGSPLDLQAVAEGWLERFPIWEWVGGRTSATSAVGLLPAALAGVDIAALLEGAAAMDARTRDSRHQDNPAALLALAWLWLGEGRGSKRMVVLPYKDRLALFPRYVQQLVMESVGKRHDRRGTIVEQGLTVLGHKGSSDNHSYMQQVREGTPDAFTTFIGVHEVRLTEPVDLGEGATLADYLAGYLEATREALYERQRESVTITLDALSPRSLGALIALYERAVGLYAELIDVNAYDQPAVEKDAAAAIVDLQRLALSYLMQTRRPLTAEEIATGLDRPDAVETIFKSLERLAVGRRRGVIKIGAPQIADSRFAVGAY